MEIFNSFAPANSHLTYFLTVFTAFGSELERGLSCHDKLSAEFAVATNPTSPANPIRIFPSNIFVIQVVPSRRLLTSRQFFKVHCHNVIPKDYYNKTKTVPWQRISCSSYHMIPVLCRGIIPSQILLNY